MNNGQWTMDNEQLIKVIVYIRNKYYFIVDFLLTIHYKKYE